MEQPEADYNSRMREALESAEVVSVFFVRVGQSLILDFRQEEGVPAAVLIDDMVSSPQDRLSSFAWLRPELPLPERLTLAPWTGPVRDFAYDGLVEVMLERCAAIGGEGLREDAARAYRRLAKREQRFLQDLARGIGMKTMWKRPNG
jgi:hypothetical protein